MSHVAKCKEEVWVNLGVKVSQQQAWTRDRAFIICIKFLNLNVGSGCKLSGSRWSEQENSVCLCVLRRNHIMVEGVQMCKEKRIWTYHLHQEAQENNLLLGAAHAEGEAAWTTEVGRISTVSVWPPWIAMIDTCLKSALKTEKVLIPDLICISKDAGYLFSIVFIIQRIKVRSHYLNSS